MGREMTSTVRRARVAGGTIAGAPAMDRPVRGDCALRSAGRNAAVASVLLAGIVVAIQGAGCSAIGIQGDPTRSVVMQPLPRSPHPLVVRTDFTDQAAWETVRSEIQAENDDGFRASVNVLDDRQYTDASTERIRALAANQEWHGFVMVVDHEGLTRADHAFLVIGLRDWNRHCVFRVIPSQAWNIENNVSLGNAGLEDYYDSLDESGTFRGH